MAKPGRPARFTKKAADEICRRIETGESLRNVCRDKDMPHRSIVLRWISADREGFRSQYEQAVDMRAVSWLDDLVDIADNGSDDTQRDRLRIDTRKWIASKLLPRYSDRGKDDDNAAINVLADQLKALSDRLPV